MEQIQSGPMAGRTVLVTGGTGGIGRATAVGLASMGLASRSPAETAPAPTTRPAKSTPRGAGE
jgi:NAD(P)-dependent dehydrogenase (short-subunit alcohol dehydrogenase family)